MLIVELDGGQHSDAIAYDEARTRFMEAEGFRVLRFWNNDVLTQVDLVKEQILQALQTLTPAHSRKREREQDTQDQSPRNNTKTPKYSPPPAAPSAAPTAATSATPAPTTCSRPR